MTSKNVSLYLISLKFQIGSTHLTHAVFSWMSINRSKLTYLRNNSVNLYLHHFWDSCITLRLLYLRNNFDALSFREVKER